MNKALIALAVAGFAGSVAFGQQIDAECSFENGVEALGVFAPDNVAYQFSSEFVRTGNTSLVVEDLNITSTTSQVYLAYIENLVNNDLITAGFWAYDTTPDGSPSVRIWGHYADSGDVNSFRGSASGNSTYSGAEPWSFLEYTWTFDAGDPVRDALVVEVRPYGSASISDNRVWIDDVSVFVDSASGIATITTTCENGGGGYTLDAGTLVGGQVANFVITGATPNTPQYVIYSLRGLGSTFVPQLNVTLDLAAPELGTSGRSDANGEALLSTFVPGLATGRDVWLQAAEPNNKTNVVATTIQ